jgi:hypothetical protein
VLSKGFDEAPPVIIKALKRLTWAGKQTLAETVEPFHPFNELLSIGYFEETSIGVSGAFKYLLRVQLIRCSTTMMVRKN